MAADDEAARLAKSGSQIAMQPLLMLPAPLRVEAAAMMFKAIFMSDVKAEKRLELFNEVVDRMRDDIVDDLNKGMTDGTKANGDRRNDRKASARKKARGRKKPK